MAEAIQTEYYKEDQNMIAKDKKQNIIAEYGRTPGILEVHWRYRLLF